MKLLPTLRLSQYALAALIVAITVGAGPAHAKDMQGKFGVGFMQSFGGVSGLSLRYWLSRSVALELDTGVAFATNTGGQNSTAFVGAFGVFYAAVQHRTANLLVGVRGDFGVRNAPSDAPATRLEDAVNARSAPAAGAFSGSTFQFNLEIPLIIEYFLSDSVSLQLATGILLVFVPEQGTFLNVEGIAYEDSSFVLGLGTGGFLGSLGVTFWF